MIYIPSHKDVPTLKYFKPVESDNVKTMIMSMQSNSCELDQIPTAVLKEILDYMLPSITKLVNLSLENGLFVDSWKCAVVRPLLKKPGLEQQNSNYRPVSILIVFVQTTCENSSSTI